jgi:hypothetical protein
VQGGLPRAVCCIDLTPLVQQVCEDSDAIVQRSPLQREKALLVWTVQRLGLRLRQFSQPLKVTEGSCLAHCGVIKAIGGVR